ncbi:MAG: M20/M25/M40 family metallo-hydrolase, partial [Calditrichaeota bacterium]
MNPARMQGLTRRLIALDSVTGNEAEICRFLRQELPPRGFSVRGFPVSGDRENLLVTTSGTPPKILFNTHLDTVPVQYGPHEDRDRVYGRGACDTHGVLAAQLEAVQDLAEEG